MPDFNFNSIVAVITILGTGITIGLLIWTVFNALASKRYDDFKKTWRHLSNDRGRYYEIVLEMYEKLFHGEIEENKVVTDGNMIKREGWLPRTEEKGFYLLDEVTVDIIGDKGDIARLAANMKTSPRKDFPNRKVGYAENMDAFLQDETGRKRMFDNNVFVLQNYEYSRDAGVKLTVFESTYFEYQNTCEVLSYELVRTLRRKAEQSALELPQLKQRWEKRDIFDFTNRNVAIGINTITIFQNYKPGDAESNGSVFLLHNRSKGNVAEAMGTTSVVPAGTYQSVVLKASKREKDKVPDRFEYDKRLSNTVTREYCEEILGKTEYQDYDSIVALNDDFKKAHEGKYNLYFLGLGLDALSTKCEIMTCMVIDLENVGIDDDIHPAKYKNNYEGEISVLDFNKKNLKYFINESKTMPVARDIFKIIHDNFEFFDNKVMQDESSSVPQK